MASLFNLFQMDFNFEQQREFCIDLQNLLKGIKYCGEQIEAGFDPEYHKKEKDRRMKLYKSILHTALSKLEGNAVVIGDIEKPY